MTPFFVESTYAYLMSYVRSDRISPGTQKKGPKMRRFKLSKGKSRRSFSRNADRTHKINFKQPHQRGGIRL